MATKVQLLSIDGRKAEHVKRSKADALVRRLLAIKVAHYIYQLVMVSSNPNPEPKRKARGPMVYQHHIEPRLCRISRREMEELERYMSCKLLNPEQIQAF